MLELVLRWEGCGEQKFVAPTRSQWVVAGYGVWGGGDCRYKGLPVSAQYLLWQSHCWETWGFEWGKWPLKSQGAGVTDSTSVTSAAAFATATERV